MRATYTRIIPFDNFHDLWMGWSSGPDVTSFSSNIRLFLIDMTIKTSINGIAQSTTKLIDKPFYSH